MIGRAILVSGLLAAASACGGHQAETRTPAGGGAAAAPATLAPHAWDDYASWHLMSTEKWISKTHGGRFVEVYVNDTGFEAYKNEDAQLPVGTIIVKPSFANEGGKAGAAGPIFVMEKKPAGFNPDGEDWAYEFVWSSPTGKWANKGPIDWSSPSHDVNYCSDCHENYDRELGYVPKDKRAW